MRKIVSKTLRIRACLLSTRPNVILRIGNWGKNQKKHTQMNFNDKQNKQFKNHLGTIRYITGCPRAIYKQLKAVYKKEQAL